MLAGSAVVYDGTAKVHFKMRQCVVEQCGASLFHHIQKQIQPAFNPVRIKTILSHPKACEVDTGHVSVFARYQADAAYESFGHFSQLSQALTTNPKGNGRPFSYRQSNCAAFGIRRLLPEMN